MRHNEITQNLDCAAHHYQLTLSYATKEDYCECARGQNHTFTFNRRCRKGVQVTIARNGDPVVELVPLKTQTQRIPGTYPELQVGPEFFAPLSDQDLEDWEGTP